MLEYIKGDMQQLDFFRKYVMIHYYDKFPQKARLPGQP